MFKIMNKNNKQKCDQGFTLVELLVVIIIIGILAAVAVPAFMNQREKAARATVISDVKNAAIVMQDASIDNTGYVANIPNYNKLSPDSRVITDITKSGKNNFCLIGTHTKYPSIRVDYDSLKGGILPNGATCSSATAGIAAGGGQTFAASISSIKALVIYDQGNAAAGILNAAGITNVTYKLAGYTLADLQGYDVIVASANVWAISNEVAVFLIQAQLAGFDIITDGNDNTAGTMPLISSGIPMVSQGGYNPTGRAVSPAFPYIFNETPWTGDTWHCALTVRPSSVIVGDYTAPDGSVCATMIADVNNGKWFNMSLFMAGPTFQSGLLWVTQ